MCCTRLAETQDAKTRKKSPSRHHRTTLSGHIFANKAPIGNRKKILLSSNISSTCPHNMVNFGLIAAEIGPVVWAPQLISTGFASWQRYCTALQYWAAAKLCGVEQTVPPIFDRAAITLGIGPHSSYLLSHNGDVFQYANEKCSTCMKTSLPKLHRHVFLFFGGSLYTFARYFASRAKY